MLRPREIFVIIQDQVQEKKEKVDGIGVVGVLRPKWQCLG